MTDRALNDFRFQYAYSKYEVAPPYSHGSWDPGDFGADRLRYCTPVFSYPSIQIGGCGNTQMGPEGRWQLKNDFSYFMPSWGGTHQWKIGVDYSYITFQADGSFIPSAPGRSRATSRTTRTTRPPSPTQYTTALPTYANIPVHHFSTYLQDDWQLGANVTLNLGLRYDLQTGVFNEDLPELLGQIEDKLGRDGTFPLPIPFHDGSERRGDKNNFGPRVGFAWDPRAAASPTSTAATGCSTTTSAR